jgi:hypothetical protein
VGDLQGIKGQGGVSRDGWTWDNWSFFGKLYDTDED